MNQKVGHATCALSGAWRARCPLYEGDGRDVEEEEEEDGNAAASVDKCNIGEECRGCGEASENRWG